MDHIDKALTTLSGSSSRFSLAIRAALTIGKKTLDKYHNKTGESDVYHIVMGVFLPPQLYVCCTLLTLTHWYIVLHPCHKLEYFKRNKWDAKSIEAAHDLVQDEFDRSYWLLDVEGDDRTTHADGNVSVSDHLLTCYVLRAPIFIFYLLTNTFPSRDLSLLSLYHMTTSPDHLPIHFTMWFLLAVHVTHTDSYLVACILGFTRESVRLGMTPYFVRWLLTSTGTSSIRLESWQLPRCI